MEKNQLTGTFPYHQATQIFHVITTLPLLSAALRRSEPSRAEPVPVTQSALNQHPPSDPHRTIRAPSDPRGPPIRRAYEIRGTLINQRWWRRETTFRCTRAYSVPQERWRGEDGGSRFPCHGSYVSTCMTGVHSERGGDTSARGLGTSLLFPFLLFYYFLKKNFLKIHPQNLELRQKGP